MSPKGGRPPISEDTAQLSVRLSRETLERLRAQPYPMSASVRMAVDEWLERQEAASR